MTVRSFRVVTAIGKDRPGLVHGVSEVIHSAGANLEDSRMAVLGGEFAMVLLFSGTPDALALVEQRGHDVAKQLGLELFYRDTDAPTTIRASQRMRVSGLDRPGIVDTVTEVLARLEINLGSVETRVENQPLTGTPVFTLLVEMRLPQNVSLEEVRKELTRVCEKEHLEFEILPA